MTAQICFQPYPSKNPFFSGVRKKGRLGKSSPSGSFVGVGCVAETAEMVELIVELTKTIAIIGPRLWKVWIKRYQVNWWRN
jgi:hypothetical protein